MTAPELNVGVDFDKLIASFKIRLEEKGAVEEANVASDLLHGLVLAEREHGVRCAASVKCQCTSRRLIAYLSSRARWCREFVESADKSIARLYAAIRIVSQRTLSCSAQQLRGFASVPQNAHRSCAMDGD